MSSFVIGVMPETPFFLSSLVALPSTETKPSSHEKVNEIGGREPCRCRYSIPVQAFSEAGPRKGDSEVFPAPECLPREQTVAHISVR
jgi:hypothetical protein